MTLSESSRKFSPLILPKHFGITKVLEFLRDSEFIFDIEDKEVEGMLLDMGKVEKISLLNLLLVYKFMSYTVEHACFRDPKIRWSTSKVIKKQIAKYGFMEFINSCLQDPEDLDAYRKLKTRMDGGVLFAPQRLLREEEARKSLVEKKFVEDVSQHFNHQKKTQIVASCLSEVLMNFWEHATEENKTVIVAHCKDETLEVACADNGQGILSNLSPSFPDLTPVQILEKAVCRGVTSKEKTYHMGYGLWLVNLLAKSNDGELFLISEGKYLRSSAKRVDKGTCGYWKGTIVYVRLHLSKPVSISDLSREEPSIVRINWS